jgi:pyruvate,orthophosphate dikinase
MHPLVAKGEEMKFLKELTDRTAKAVIAEKNCPIDYKVGTMVELPRAAIRAGDLAQNAEFFSFGTNDLTQTTFGISRDDSGRFLNAYIDKGIFEKDPFVSLDQDGVGDLIRIAAERGRAARADVKLGICGEHGGDPASIQFCESLGLDYVSCSAYRVPIARLAAAQAAVGEREKDR